MKFTKLFASVLLLALVAMVSCKSKSAKELIVNKWKVTNIDGAPADMTDSMKNVVYASATMEFTKDGKFISSGMGPSKSGTYSLSDDGKTLSTTDEGSTIADVLTVEEISDNKMVVNVTKEKMKVSFAVK